MEGDKMVDEILKEINENKIQNVRFQFLDINSVARSKTIPIRHFQKAIDTGVFFPIAVFTSDPNLNFVKDSCLMKKYMTSDMVCLPDLSTFTVLPWVKNTASVIISGRPASVVPNDAFPEPRNILKAQLEALKARNLSMFSSFEYEFWVVDEKTREPILSDGNAFSTLRLAKHQSFLDGMVSNLLKAGIDIDSYATEFWRGMFEITMEPCFGLQSSDKATTLRTGIKEMALQQGYVASFMTKPFESEGGASGHLNHSLWTPDGKTQLTGDASRPYGLSEIGEHWLAGLLKHASTLSFLQAPTHNCRDRMSPIYLVPWNATWGIDNRSCAIRLKKLGNHGVYLENRMGSGAGNPYISLAATIAAGIDGMDRKLALPPPVPLDKNSEECVQTDTDLLPTDVESAIECLKEDEVMLKAFGKDFVDNLISIRRFEAEKISEGDKLAVCRKLYFDYI